MSVLHAPHHVGMDNEESHEARLAEYLRQEAEWKDRFRSAVEDLVDATHPNIYAIGDGQGGWCLLTVQEALDARHLPERAREPKPQPERTGPPRLTSHHRHLHRLGERDGWTCAYCGDHVGCPCAPDLPAAVSDHVLPRSRGGADTLDNRALACWPCNQAKGDRTPDEWGGP